MCLRSVAGYKLCGPEKKLRNMGTKNRPKALKFKLLYIVDAMNITCIKNVR
jgi:hypothetical protein